jgi:hypothetical protein
MFDLAENRLKTTGLKQLFLLVLRFRLHFTISFKETQPSGFDASGLTREPASHVHKHLSLSADIRYGR